MKQRGFMIVDKLEFNNELIKDKPYTNPEQPNPKSKATIFFLKFN